MSWLLLLLQTMLIQPAPLTVRSVYKSLRSMAEQKGSGATARRKQTILSLLRSCRQGPSATTTLLHALSMGYTLHVGIPNPETPK